MLLHGKLISVPSNELSYLFWVSLGTSVTRSLRVLMQVESSSTGISVLESLHESDPFDSADETDHPYHPLEELAAGQQEVS